MKKEKTNDQGSSEALGKRGRGNESHPISAESYAALFDSSLYTTMKQGYLSSKKARSAKTTDTAETGPVWEGTLTLPTVLRLSACAWRHSFLGSKQGPAQLEELGLPSDLLIKGRIEQHKGLEYLQQVLKSPTRCIALLQVGHCTPASLYSPEQAGSTLHNKIKSHPASPTMVSHENGGFSETATGSSLYDHFASRQRWGVIYSNHGHPLPGARSTQWVMKDLYLIPVDKSEARAPPLNTIDVELLDRSLSGPGPDSHSRADSGTHMLYLVAVLGRPSVPSHSVKEHFQYKPIDSTTDSVPSGERGAPMRSSHAAATVSMGVLEPRLALPVGSDFSSTLDSLSAVLGNTDSPLLNDISESIVSSKIKSPAYP